ncbi:MAG TPA: YbaK/EbsC family protein [Candidatus Limnocylindrales bacterium]|nr:YbaK/EbsC family protein [Candidatus Limnocylindrales bacterium]
MIDSLAHPAIRRVVEAAAQRGVELEIRTFPASTHTAEQAARAVGAQLGQIVKSLVFVTRRDDGSLEPVLCLMAGHNRVDPARLGAVIGRSDVRRASAREANELTGFVIGGIPPFGHGRRLRVVMDPDVGRFATVWAAAGLPNSVFPIAPASLRLLADAEVAPIADPPAIADVAAIAEHGEPPIQRAS